MKGYNEQFGTYTSRYFAMKNKTNSFMITVKVTDKSGNVLGYTNLWPSDYYYELEQNRGFSSKPWWKTESPKTYCDRMDQMIEEDRKRDEEELAQRIETEELSEQKPMVYKIIYSKAAAKYSSYTSTREHAQLLAGQYLQAGYSVEVFESDGTGYRKTNI